MADIVQGGDVKERFVWTPERIEEAMSYYFFGLQADEIAEKIGCTRRHVYKLFQDRDSLTTRLSDYDKRMILTQYYKGIPADIISRNIRKPFVAVKRFLNQLRLLKPEVAHNFQPGCRYKFSPRIPEGPETVRYDTVVYEFVDWVSGDGKSLAMFRSARGGYIETFTEVQLSDYVIEER